MAIRDERIEMRLSAEHKAIIERAAAVTGQPLSAFAVSSLVERAEEILQRHEQTVLSRRDQQIFLAMLEAGEEPTAALVKAAKSLR